MNGRRPTRRPRADGPDHGGGPPAAHATIDDFQLTCIGGLEDIAVDELRTHLGSRATSVRTEPGATGRVFFTTTASPRRLLELGCPTAIHAVAGQAHDVTVGQPGLERILRCVRQVPVAAVQRLARACAPELETARARLRVSLQGAHRFTAAEVETGVAAILRQAGIDTTGARGAGPAAPSAAGVAGIEAGLDLGVHVRKRRALVTVRLGPQRPAGDPVREGWSGPAAASIARLLDLDPGLLLGGVPAAPGLEGVWLGQDAAQVLARARVDRLPLMDGAVPVLLQAAPTPAAQDAALAEAVRVVAPGGIAGLLVQRGDAFAARLRAAGLPLEVMAVLPFYARRRRCALFLLERLDLLGIEAA